MSITTTTDLPAPIRQSLAAGMLSVPTPNFNYIIPADKYAMPRNGGTTIKNQVVVKSPLIDSEARQGDEAEGESHRERLSEGTGRDATVQSSEINKTEAEWRFLRPNPLVPPTTPLGNTGIEPTSQVATRNIIDATISFYGTSVILNEQVIIQDQDPKPKNGVIKSTLMNSKLAA